MTIESLDFNTLAAANPATTIPGGYAKPAGSDPAAIFNTVPKLFGRASGATSMWYNTTVLPGNVIDVEITLPNPVFSDSAGGVMLDSSMNGLMWMTGTGTNNFRIFAITNGQLSGGALWTQATAPIASAAIRFRRTINAGNDEYELFQNGAKLGATYTNNNYDVIYGGVHSRGGAIRALAVEYTPAQSIATLTSPLVPGSAFSGTATGFVNGAATLSFGGLSIAVTIAAGAFSGTVPMLADNIAYPVLPATGLTVTLTQGATSATIQRSVSLPAGFDVTRDDSNNPSNFADMVTDDPTYLPYAYEQAGNPLTTDDRCYFPTTRNLLIKPNGEVSADAGEGSFTETIFIHRNSENIYSHDVTISEAGVIISVSGQWGKIEFIKKIGWFG